MNAAHRPGEPGGTAALRIEQNAGVWRVTLNRPEHGNACSADLVRCLGDTLTRAADSGAHAFVLQGAGRHFCTGFDLAGLEQETDDTLLARFVRIELLLQQLARAPFLTIALAQGRSIGAGADLFAACRVRLALADSSFAFPGARGFGLVLGTRRLACRVGTDVALEWVESGRSVTAEEASACGLVSAVVHGPERVEQLIAARDHGDHWLGNALRRAAEPSSRTDDAADLDLLLRSAARPGLRERIAAHLQRLAASRIAARPLPTA